LFSFNIATFLQVLDGAYDGVTLKCASQAIIADNETGKNGYTVPLEVKPAGQFEPLYRTPLSIQVTLLDWFSSNRSLSIYLCFLGEGFLCCNSFLLLHLHSFLLLHLF
jgi:hypothetical protein